MSKCNAHNSLMKPKENVFQAKRTEFHKHFFMLPIVSATHPHYISSKMSPLIIKSETAP